MPFSLNTGKKTTTMCVYTNMHLNMEGKLHMVTNNYTARL